LAMAANPTAGRQTGQAHCTHLSWLHAYLPQAHAKTKEQGKGQGSPSNLPPASQSTVQHIRLTQTLGNRSLSQPKPNLPTMLAAFIAD
jgi:hypothetical protein